MYSFDDNETIAFSKVHEFQEPLKNLIAIYTGDSPIRREAYELKDFEIIPIREWILRNRDLSIQELFEKVIKDNLVIFSDFSVFKSTLAYFYVSVHKRRKQEVLDFLGYEELCSEELQRQYDEKQLQKDLEKHRKLQKIKRTFQKIEPLISSKIVYEKIRYLVKVSWSSRNTEENDIEDIFETLRCSENLVFVTGVDRLGLRWSKFFLDPQKTTFYEKAELTDKIVAMRKKLFKDYRRKIKEAEMRNTMIYFIFAENLQSFALLNLKRSVLLVETLFDSPIDVLKTIEENSELVFDRSSKVILNISGSFNIYNVEILPEIFLDMVLNEEFMGLHLVFDETIGPTYAKKKMFYHFKLPLVSNQGLLGYEDLETTGEYVYSFEKTVLFFLSQEYMSSMMKVYDNEGNLVEIKTDSSAKTIPFVRIHFFRALSEDFTIQFYHKLNRLFQYYNNNKRSYLKKYLEIFEDDDKAKDYLQSPIRVNVSESLKNLSILQQYDPELFVERYARKCQKPRQPMIIEKSQVDDYLERGYQVLGYPLINQKDMPGTREPKWYFICESDRFKYPGLKENTLSNSSLYPFLPCCYETDQSSQIDSSFAIVLGGSQQTTEQKIQKTQKLLPFVSEQFLESIKRKHKIITDRVINPGRLALLEAEKSQTQGPEIQSEIQKQFGLVSKESTIISLLFPRTEVFRFGVPISKNSALHAVCIALGIREYFDSKDRENFIMNLRVQMAKTVHPEVCKQELCEYTINEIREMLKSYEVFDTRYFYRAIEEFFNVNLFVLTYYPSHLYDKNRITNYIITLTTSSATKLYSFETPRHRLFYTRRIRRDRDTIVIFKHIGTEADSLKTPHCELIAHTDSKGSLKLIFSKDEKDILQSLYENFIMSLNVYRWNLKHGLISYPIQPISDKFLDILEPQIEYQIIDKIGKKRGYVMKDNITILFPPLPPDNRSSGRKFGGKIRRVTFQQALEFVEKYSKFVEVVGFSVKINNKSLMRGVWLNSYYEGFYIPVFEQNIPEEFQKYPIFEDFPCTERRNNTFQTYETYKRVVTAFLQFCAHKIRAKEIKEIKVLDNSEETIQNFEENIRSLKKVIRKRIFRVSDIETILRDSGLLKDQTLFVPNEDIKKSIIYAFKLYNVLMIRMRSSFTADVYKEEKYEELRSFWNVFPSDMKKHFMTRWFEVPNKDKKLSTFIDDFFERKQYSTIYRVININLFREIERALVRIENEFYIAFRHREAEEEGEDEEYDKAIHVIVCKYWRLRLKIIPYDIITEQVEDIKSILKSIVSEDGLIIYKTLSSGEPYVAEEYEGNDGKKSLNILEIKNIQTPLVKNSNIYFSLLPISPNVRAEIEPLKEKHEREKEKKEKEREERRREREERRREREELTKERKKRRKKQELEEELTETLEEQKILLPAFI
jgi:hypothetical protein